MCLGRANGSPVSTFGGIQRKLVASLLKIPMDSTETRGQCDYSANGASIYITEAITEANGASIRLSIYRIGLYLGLVLEVDTPPNAHGVLVPLEVARQSKFQN